MGQLFNGKDLEGLKQAGTGSHYVEDGLIKSHGGMGLLYWTGEKFGNCRIRVVFRMRDTLDNSGVFIRIPVEPREAWMPIHYGYEIQIDNHPEIWKEDEYHYTGTLYSLTKPAAKVGKKGPQWNTFEIILQGSRTVVFVNGSKVTDYTEGDPVPERIFDWEPLRGPRPEFMQTAHKSSSTSVILSHNHTSGNLTPSEADKDLTKKIKEGGKVLDIAVLNHLILTSESCFCFCR